MVTSSIRQNLKRGWGAMLKYRGWTAFIAFVIVVSAVLWGFSHAKRVYRVESGIALQSSMKPEIAQGARDKMIASLRQSLADVDVSSTDTRIKARISTDNPNQGYVALTNALEHAARVGNQHAIGAVAAQREELTNRVAEITANFNTAQARVDKLEQTYPDLADGNTGPAMKLERITTRLEERTSRRKVVEEQVQRTEAYAKKMRELGSSAPAPAPAAKPVEAPASPLVDRDPEVMQLAAQMALLDEQLEEQITRLRRTEQHPYVVDLRTRQSALQQKLRAARDRAGAGQPPPAAAVAAASNAGSAGGANLGVQAADFQLQQLISERDQLAAEITQLKEQETAVRAQIDKLRPARDQWRQAKDKVASLKQDREAAEAKLRAFDDAARAGSPISVESISANYKTPIWPRADVMFLSAIGAGLLAAFLAAWWREKMDRTYQTPERFAAFTGAPVLGVVEEIYSPSHWRWYRLWRWVGRPVVVIALLAYPVMSAMALMQ